WLVMSLSKVKRCAAGFCPVEPAAHNVPFSSQETVGTCDTPPFHSRFADSRSVCVTPAPSAIQISLPKRDTSTVETEAAVVVGNSEDGVKFEAILMLLRLFSVLPMIPRGCEPTE